MAVIDAEFFECELLPVPPDVAAHAAEISGCDSCSE